MNASEPQMKQRKHVDDSKAAALWRLQDRDGAVFVLPYFYDIVPSQLCCVVAVCGVSIDAICYPVGSRIW